MFNILSKMKKSIKIGLVLFVGLIVYNFCTIDTGPDGDEAEAAGSQLNYLDKVPSFKDGSLIIVNFRKPSMEDRLYIYNRKNMECIYTGAVLHGNGGKSTASTPEFSNKIGSKCSSLGLFKVSEESHTKLGVPCLRLDGLSPTNSNARARGIVIHPSIMVTLTPFGIDGMNYPLTPESEGCFSVSWHTFLKIKHLKRPIYLESYYG